MNEEEIQAENIAEETSDTSSPDVEIVTQEETSEEPEQEAQPDSEDSVEEPDQQDNPKPTRAERRIRQLSNTLKEIGNHQPQQAQQEYQQPQPEEIDLSGETELTWDQLNQYVDQRAEKKLQEYQQRQTLEQQVSQYKQTALDYASDLEQLEKTIPELNPESDRFNKQLADTFDKYWQNMNFSPDRTGKPVFTPKVKASDYWSDFKKLIEAGKTTGQAEATASMAKSMAEAPIGPGKSSQGKRKYTLEELDAMSEEEAYRLLNGGRSPFD